MEDSKKKWLGGEGLDIGKVSIKKSLEQYLEKLEIFSNSPSTQVIWNRLTKRIPNKLNSQIFSVTLALRRESSTSSQKSRRLVSQ